MNEEKYKYMMHNSQCQKEIAQSNERYEHVNELTGIFVFEYNIPDKEYYVCTSFDEVFSLIDRSCNYVAKVVLVGVYRLPTKLSDK